MEALREEISDFKNIFRKIKKMDFSGNSGQAIKNSTYQLATTLIAKIGSLIFTILLARILMPELFGLYSLALSTIVIFASLTGMGIGESLIKLVSENLNKGKFSKAKTYFSYLRKYRLLLIFIFSIFLLISSYFIANIYYQKPIFFALIAGIIYLPLMSMTSFMESLFMSTNNFKRVFLKEIIFQTTRLVMVISVVFILLKYSFSNDIILSFVILSISFCYLISFIYYTFNTRKIFFLREKSLLLTSLEKKSLKIFLIPLAATTLSGIFFGYIDIIMLGRFVSATFIANYNVSLNLVASIGTILSFSSIALLPIFSKVKGNSLRKGFKRSQIIILLTSSLTTLLVIIFSKHLILWTYGSSYLDSINLLILFSPMIIIISLTSLYNALFISQGKTTFLAIILIITTLLNLVLNYFLIQQGLQFGMEQALKGAIYATLISKGFYLLFLVSLRKTFN